MDKVRLALCCIAKLENPYIDEWVQHHLAIGFDHIFIYDNNDEDYEYVGDRISKNKDSVTIVPWRKRQQVGMQEEAYTDCYRTNGGNYDFMAFLDVDEFLVLRSNESLKDKLKKITADNVIIPWVVYTYNGLYSRDLNTSVVESFKETTPDDCFYVKSIVRTKLPTMLEKGCSVHGQYGATSYSDIDGESLVPLVPHPKNENSYTVNKWSQFENFGGCRTAVINHYRFKSVDEFIEFKLKRLYCNNDPEVKEGLIKKFLKSIKQDEREQVESYIRARI